MYAVSWKSRAFSLNHIYNALDKKEKKYSKAEWYNMKVIVTI